jgi:putative peptidoglycan lipid II flippase
MKKTALIIMIITIISKFFGFARDIFLSFFFGATNISDAYIISLTIPMTLFTFLGAAISTSYIPLYSDISNRDNIEKADKFTANLTNLLMIICTLMIVTGIIFTEEIVKIFAAGFQGETLSLAILFTRISLFGIYFSVLTAVFKSYLQIKNNYIIPALIGLPYNIISIIAMALASNYDLAFLSLGTVIAIGSQLLLLLPFVMKNGYKHKFNFDFRNKNINRLVQLSIPIMFGISINEINVLVDKTIASSISVGGISALSYANRLNWFIQGIIVTSIATVIYPTISRMAVNKDIVNLKKVLQKSMVSVVILIIPATIGAIIFSEPIIKLLFGRGAFDDKAIKMTSQALIFYSVGMLGFGFREVLSRVFYAFQDTRTPMVNASFGMVLNIILNIVLSKYLGIGGLALATSLAAIVTTILMILSLRKKIQGFGMKKVSISLIKVLISSLLMGIIAKFAYIYSLSIFNDTISLFFAILIGAVSYISVLCFFKIEEIDEIMRAIKKKSKNIISKLWR